MHSFPLLVRKFDENLAQATANRGDAPSFRVAPIEAQRLAFIKGLLAIDFADEAFGPLFEYLDSVVSSSSPVSDQGRLNEIVLTQMQWNAERTQWMALLLATVFRGANAGKPRRSLVNAASTLLQHLQSLLQSQKQAIDAALSQDHPSSMKDHPEIAIAWSAALRSLSVSNKATSQILATAVNLDLPLNLKV